MRWSRLVPVAFLATGACATRTDVQVLQNDLRIMRAESAQADSARRVQLERVIASLEQTNDSLRTMSSRFAQFQGGVQENLYSFAQQLIQIQELTGQSQRRLQEMRSELEQRNQGAEMTAPSPSPTSPAGVPGRPAAADTSAGAPAPGAPGPNQLFQLSLDQLRRGSAGAARAGFADLVRQYPTSDVAPEAQFYIGEAYAAEGNMSAADSAYQAVVQRYPQSTRAPTALYKYAQSLQRSGRTGEARAALNSVVSKYPRSDEAELAREQLRALP